MSHILPHTGFGAISLLLQNGDGNLEIRDHTHSDSFMPVAPCQMEMTNNASDTLQRWTNDVL